MIFDIDGTLADISAREHHVRSNPKNWDAFFEGMAEDKAVASMVRLCNILYDAGVYIVLCSGHNQRHRGETIRWMQREGVKYHELRLRADDDFRSEVTAKREMLRGINRKMCYSSLKTAAASSKCGAPRASSACNALPASFERTSRNAQAIPHQAATVTG